MYALVQDNLSKCLIGSNCGGGKYTRACLNPDFFYSTQVYRWTPQATDIIITSIKNGATPKVILRNLRDKGCFVANEEPSQIQQDILIFKVKLFREKERKRKRKCQLTY